MVSPQEHAQFAVILQTINIFTDILSAHTHPTEVLGVAYPFLSCIYGVSQYVEVIKKEKMNRSKNVIKRS